MPWREGLGAGGVWVLLFEMREKSRCRSSAGAWFFSWFAGVGTWRRRPGCFSGQLLGEHVLALIVGFLLNSDRESIHPPLPPSSPSRPPYSSTSTPTSASFLPNPLIFFSPSPPHLHFTFSLNPPQPLLPPPHSIFLPPTTSPPPPLPRSTTGTVRGQVRGGPNNRPTAESLADRRHRGGWPSPIRRGPIYRRALNCDPVRWEKE